MSKEVFYATNNPGKVYEVTHQLQHVGIKVITPKDLNIDLDVAETGNTLEDNARLKLEGFRSLVGERVVLSDDTGLEIDALNKEPGIHVRRWKDKHTRMTDQEIIDYCIERMKGIEVGQRGAQFRTVLAITRANSDIKFVNGTLRGVILEQPSTSRVEGFPFESLFFVSEWNLLLGEARDIPIQERKGMLNHREKAVRNVVPIIDAMLG